LADRIVGTRPLRRKDKVMTDTMIQRHKCSCDKCGQSHWVEEVVEMETLPIGLDISIVPVEYDKTWEITVVNNIQDTTGVIEATTMKQCLMIVEQCRKMLMKDGYRLVVSTPRSRFETHSRINRLEYNQWIDATFKTKKKKDDWYEKLVQKMGRQTTKASNKIHRLGYGKDK
jgi:hypothetical protein